MSECKNTHPEKNKRRFRDRPVLTRAAITLAWIAGTVVFLAGIALTAVTIWLTPERLTGIINTEASKRIDADITAHNVRYTLWSSFPRLCIDIDSIKIVSRTLTAYHRNCVRTSRGMQTFLPRQGNCTEA